MDSSSEHSEQEDALKRCRWLRINWNWFKVGSSKFGIQIRWNPVVTLLSALVIRGFVVFCVLLPEFAKKQMAEWKSWITQTQDAWAVFIIALYFSKYGTRKLGKPNEKPEFKDTTYFTMLFAAGIGIGLFCFGVGKLITFAWISIVFRILGNNFKSRAQSLINHSSEVCVSL